MFLETGSRQRKTQQENKREKKQQKNNLKQSSSLKRIFAKSKKKKKHIHPERENSEKKDTWKTYGNDEKRLKIKK